jgi:hypothetical protein
VVPQLWRLWVVAPPTVFFECQCTGSATPSQTPPELSAGGRATKEAVVRGVKRVDGQNKRLNGQRCGQHLQCLRNRSQSVLDSLPFVVRFSRTKEILLLRLGNVVFDLKSLRTQATYVEL